MNVDSVICQPPDARIHLAPMNGTSVYTLTLCLERWAKREPFREDSEFCPECLEKWSKRQPAAGGKQ